MTKKKISLRLSDDEVAVVGSIARWQHLILVYEAFANDPDNPQDKQAWLDSAEWIREWMARADVRTTEDEWQ